MKKLLIGGAVMFALSSCGGGWSSADKEKFKKDCISQSQAQAGMTAEKAEDYCECMGPKVQKKYPTAAEVNNTSTSDPALIEMAKDCLK